MLVFLCPCQSEVKDPENDLNENALLFPDVARDEVLRDSSEVGFITLKTRGVVSASSSLNILVEVHISEPKTG